MKQFFMISITLVCLYSFSPYPVLNETEQACLDIDSHFEEISTFSGTIFYFDADDHSDLGVNFSILYGDTATSVPFWALGKYVNISPDGKWIVSLNTVSDLDQTQEVWINNVETKESKLLLTTPIRPYDPKYWYWLDENHLMVSWYQESYGLDAVIVEAFTNPPIITRPSWINIADWKVVSVSPLADLALLFRRDKFLYAVYDIENNAVSAIPNTTSLSRPMRIQPEWSSDGHLAYVLPTDYDEQTQTYYEELFLAKYPETDAVQVSSLADEFGAVAIRREMNWSPDNKKIAFRMSIVDDSTRVISVGELYVLDLYSGETISLCLSPERTDLPPDFFWSPDSRYIAFIYAGNLVAVNVETRELNIIRGDVSAIYGWELTAKGDN